MAKKLIGHDPDQVPVNGFLGSLAYIDTETDPTVGAHIKAITTTDINNWDTAYGWGDHAGLYVELTGTTFNGTYPLTVNVGFPTPTIYSHPGITFNGATGTLSVSGPVSATGAVTGSNLNVSNWNTAYSWGDHSTAGYVSNNGTATLSALTLTGEIDEQVFALSGTTPSLDPANGTIQTWTLSGNSTPTDSLAEGESILLLVDDGTAYTITWPTMEWIGGSAPTLDTANTNVIELWKVGSTLYGALVGVSS